MKKWLWTVFLSVLVSIIGMFTYRLGAAYNVPYGLAITLAVVGLSTFLAGVRGGIWHQFVHATISTVIVWILAFMSDSSSTLVAIGGAALTTLWSQKASILWLYGIIIVQILVALFPQKWYAAFKS